MGCATSREAGRDMHWFDASPRVRRSLSLSTADRQRLRARAASLLSSLGLGHGRQCDGPHEYTAVSFEDMMKSANDHPAAAVFSSEEAAKPRGKPRTPTMTPPNEPEVINAWELMAGLEDRAPTPRVRHRLPSFAEYPHECAVQQPPPPQWMQADPDALITTDFDPEILSAFRQALEDTMPAQPTGRLSPEQERPVQQETKDDTTDTPKSATNDTPDLSGIVRARIDAFQEKIERRRSKVARAKKVTPLWPPGGEGKAVVYFTSLRGVRKTFMDCCAVRSVLRSYGMRVDERDVSIHAVFKAELAQLLGPGFAGAMLPRVFVDGKYLGGAEDVQVLHEAGELGHALEGCKAAPVGKLGYMEACAACGDIRFVPCATCFGSCKIFVEDGDVGEFQRCSDCNENGLVRCPVCCC